MRSLSQEQIFIITLAGALATTVLGLFFSSELSGGATTVAFVSASLIDVGAATAVVYNRLVDPLNAMGEPCAGKESLAEALALARRGFIGDMVQRIQEDRGSTVRSPDAEPLSAEAFQDVNVLVTAAVICRGLVQALPSIRDLLGRYIAALAISVPVILAVGYATRVLQQDIGTAVETFVATLGGGAYALFLVGGAAGPLEITKWRSRVVHLRRQPYPELKRMIDGWATEETRYD